jgi:membrane protein YdbS with pleckstrin-like domain
MGTITQLTDPAPPDLYWSGHSGWAMLPGLVVGGVLSALVMLATDSLADRTNLPEEWAAFARFWLVLSGWVVAGLIWSYRAAAFVYRLTSTALHVDYGMLFRPVLPIPLGEITEVETRAWVLRRMFGVGSVVIHREGRPLLWMTGVFRPKVFAKAIRDALAKARGD